MVVLRIFRDTAILALHQHLHHCALVLVQVHLRDALLERVDILGLVRDRLVHRLVVVAVELLCLACVVLAEYVVTVALHGFAAVRGRDALVRGIRRDFVRGLLRVEFKRLAPCLRILAQRLHQSLALVREVIQVHKDFRHIGIIERRGLPVDKCRLE